MNHYINHGKKEGRKYIFQFEPSVYRSIYEDLFYLNDNELIAHYNNNGKKEGRLINLPLGFNVENYKKNNIDLQHFTDQDAIYHYAKYGFRENRKY